MKASDWSRASGPLAAVLPGFEPFARGFVRRHEWVAECIYVDSSSHSRTAFYVQAFALPLFVPTDHLYFDYGGRVGDRWEDVDAELVDGVERVLPTLRELATLDGLRRKAQRPNQDLHHAEVHLCVALICGERERFDALAEQIRGWIEQVPWQRPIIERCVGLAATVHDSGEEIGRDRLRACVPGVLSLLT